MSGGFIKTNIENIGLEDVGIVVDRDKIIVNDFYQTNIPGYYAIGDVTPGQALAHVASAEGILCVEKIAGQHVEALDYGNIPGCTYCTPEIASVGLTEAQAKEQGYDIKVGKFPFSASGKASAGGNKDGFVKVIFDANNVALNFSRNITKLNCKNPNINKNIIFRHLGIYAYSVGFLNAFTRLQPSSFEKKESLEQLRALQNDYKIFVEVCDVPTGIGVDTQEDYVIDQGVDHDRIVAKGYGENIPVETNATDEGRQTNRRVEFKGVK